MKKYFLPVAFLAAALTLGAAVATAQTPAVAVGPDFSNLAERLLPTVVNISTTVKVEMPEKGDMPPMPDLPPGSPFEQFFKDFYDQYQNNGGAPADEKATSLGSGFVIDAANGYIVTNNHVIKDADEIKVVFDDNSSVDATLVGADEKTDVAVLKIKTDRKLTAAQWGDSDKARVGSWVLAIGNPFGLGGTVTAGIVSARHRDINAGPYDEFIQTDASINRGNSGGPMFDTSGQVIGINTAIYSPSGGSVGIGFAIPSNLARGVIDQLIKYGKTKRGWLGVQIQEVSPEIADTLGLGKPRGAMVAKVTPKGPAEKAGLARGDVILKFDGHDIATMRELPRLVADTEVGKKAAIVFWRKGKEMTGTVELGQLEKAEETGLIAKADKVDKKKPSTATSTPVDSIGLGVSPLTDALREIYKIGKSVQGVVVTDVRKDGSAADKGINKGDVIVEVDQQSVATPEELTARVAEAVKAGHGSVLLFVARGDDLRFVALKLKK